MKKNNVNLSLLVSVGIH